jgi:hypothetical protein
MIVYVISNFPANYVLDTYGSRPGVPVKSFLSQGTDRSNVHAGRSSSPHPYRGELLLRLVGPMHCRLRVHSIAMCPRQPFMLNAPAKIANDWFIPSHVRKYTVMTATHGDIGALCH